jgi:hypothetical protein
LFLNQLPETIKPYFDEEVLVKRIGNLNLSFDYRVGASLSDNQIQFVLMIPDYTPEEPPKDIFKRPFKPDNRRLLPTGIPLRYMMQLNHWYQSSWIAMPNNLKSALNQYQVSYFVLLQKDNHSLLFTGKPGNNGTTKINQPIISTDPEYGEVQIWADRSGYTTVQVALDNGYYPLTVPVDTISGEKKPSWLVYKFFDALPEE